MKKRKKERKPKIAIIGSKGIPSHTSGLEIYVQSISVEMVHEFDVTVFCRKRYCDRLLNDYEGVKVIHVPSINTKHLDAISYTVIATVVALCKGYDIFWYQALGPAITMPLVKKFRKTVVSTVHGLDWKREKFGKLASSILLYGEKCIAKYADNIIVMNKNDKNHFYSKWQRKATLIPNGVKESKSIEPDEIRKIGLSKGDYILFMSRLVPEKGLHTLIKAYNMLDTKTKLVIAGKGVHSSKYEKMIKELAVDNHNIIFMGDVDGKLKSELYSNAYIYVLPSTIEGQSIGLLEAMSYGLPCLVSDIPENRDVVGECGLTFVKEDTNSLRFMLEYALTNEKKINQLGKDAYIQVKKNNNYEDTISLTKEVFINLYE